METFDRNILFYCPKCYCVKYMYETTFAYVDTNNSMYDSPIKGEFIEVKCPDCGYTKKYLIASIDDTIKHGKPEPTKASSTAKKGV